MFYHACNKNLETEIKSLGQLGSEIDYFQFWNQVGLDFLKKQDRSWIHRLTSLGDRYII